MAKKPDFEKLSLNTASGVYFVSGRFLKGQMFVNLEKDGVPFRGDLTRLPDQDLCRYYQVVMSMHEQFANEMFRRWPADPKEIPYTSDN